MKLISMTDFVLSQETGGMEVQSISHQQSERTRRYYKILDYANFLRRPLELGMFIPCVDNEPFNYSRHGNEEQYQKAKERVLFEGFEITSDDEAYSIPVYRLSDNKHLTLIFANFYDRIHSKDLNTIEDLIPYRLTLV